MPIDAFLSEDGKTKKAPRWPVFSPTSL